MARREELVVVVDEGQESGTTAALMEKRPGAEGSEAIRREIETTRAALGEKLDALQDRVHAMQAKAKQIFDLRSQAKHHPWALLGVSVAAGFVAGSLGHAEAEEHATPASRDAAGLAQAPRGRPPTPRSDVFRTLKLAMGAALVDLARQELNKHLPAFGVKLDKVWEGRGLTSVSAAGALFGPDR